MLVLCGIMKVNDYVNNSFNIAVHKWEADVDLSDRLYAYLDRLNYASRSLIEDDIEKYLAKGPLDSIEIVIDSGESLYIMVTKMMREYLDRYLQADYRVIRIRFKFMNRLDRCTYLDTETSGDYLLVPVLCKTYTETIAAENWCKETLKSIVQKLYKKYGTHLTEEQTLKMLGVDEQSSIDDLKRIYQQVAEAAGVDMPEEYDDEQDEIDLMLNDSMEGESVVATEQVVEENENEVEQSESSPITVTDMDEGKDSEQISDDAFIGTEESVASTENIQNIENDDVNQEIDANTDTQSDVAKTEEVKQKSVDENQEKSTPNVKVTKTRIIMYPDDDDDVFY